MVLFEYKRKMDFGYLSFVIISRNSLRTSPEGAKTKLKDPELIIITPPTSKIIYFAQRQIKSCTTFFQFIKFSSSGSHTPTRKQL